MLNNDVSQVLREIFSGAGGISDIQPKLEVMSASFDDTLSLAELLARDAAEEELQQLLAERPQILLGALGYAQNADLAFVTKPVIGTQFCADFGMLSYDQGGCDVHLIEIERASAPLFTGKDTPGQRLQSALGQVRDWDEWIRRNQATFVRASLITARRYPCIRKGTEMEASAWSRPIAWKGLGEALVGSTTHRFDTRS